MKQVPLFLFCELSKESQERAISSFIDCIGYCGYSKQEIYNFLMQDDDEEDAIIFNIDGEMIF